MRGRRTKVCDVTEGLRRRLGGTLRRLLGLSDPAGPTPRQATTFRAAFIDVLDRAVDRGEAVLGDLGPGFFALVFPPADAGADGSPEERLQPAIDQTLARLTAQRRNVVTLTWTALRDAHPPFKPDYRSWAGRHGGWLAGDAGLVFFVELAAAAREVELAAVAFGLDTSIDFDRGCVTVGDGEYQVEFELPALVAETLWTMVGATAAAHRFTAALPAKFTAYRTLGEALGRRFPSLALQCEGTHWRYQLDGTSGKLSYRRLLRQRRLSQLDNDAFLARATLRDLCDSGDGLQRKIKSPHFTTAYPDVVQHASGGHIVAIAHDDAETTRYVPRAADDPAERWQHLELLASMRRQHHRFEGHAFRAEIGPLHALCIAGAQAVSLAVDPALVAGALAATGWRLQRVRLLSRYEDELLIADADLVDEALDVLQASLRQLCEDLGNDCGDPLQLDLSMVLADPPAGHCELRDVPGAYFDLRDRAQVAQHNGPPGRDHYFRGLCHELLGQPSQSSERFLRALRYDQTDGELNLLVGRAFNDLHEFDRATSFLEKAVHALPDDADANNSLGVAYQCAGANQQAVRAFERAAALSPEDPTILVNLGRAYVDTERLEYAREVFNRALERAPSLYEAHASLAMLHYKTGEAADALAHARVALAERPDDEIMRELVALLIDDD